MKSVPTSLMTLFLLIGLFLTALVGASQPPARDGSASQLIESLGCRGCHRIQGYGGSLGGDLTEIGNHKSVTEIAAFLSTHPRSDEDQMMPSYSTLSPEETEKLSSYLYGLYYTE